MKTENLPVALEGEGSNSFLIVFQCSFLAQSKVNNTIFTGIFCRSLVSTVKLLRQLKATSTCWKLIRTVKRSQQVNMHAVEIWRVLLRGLSKTIIIN